MPLPRIELGSQDICSAGIVLLYRNPEVFMAACEYPLAYRGIWVAKRTQ